MQNARVQNVARSAPPAAGRRRSWGFAIRVSMKTALVLVTLAVPSAAFGFGAIRGEVRDASGAPLGRARIRIDCGYGVLATQADSAGKFRFGLVTPGNCAVAADLPGHTTVMTTTVTVAEAEESSVILELAPSTDEETISMTRETPLLGRYASDRQGLTREEAALLPLVDPAGSVLRLIPSVLLFDTHRADSGDFAAGVVTPRSTLWTFRGVAVDETVIRESGAPMVNYLEEVAVVRDSYVAPLEIALAPTRGSGHRGSVTLAYFDGAQDGFVLGGEGGGNILEDRLWAWGSISTRGYGAGDDEVQAAGWLDLDISHSPKAVTGLSYMQSRAFEPHLRSDLSVASADQLRMLSRSTQLLVRAGLVAADLADGRRVDDLQFDAIADVHGSEGTVSHDIRIAGSARSFDGAGDGSAVSFSVEEIATRGNFTMNAALRFDQQESGALRWTTWSPRIAAAWMIERERRTLVFGRYFRSTEPMSAYLLDPEAVAPDEAPQHQIVAAGLEHEVIPELILTLQLRGDEILGRNQRRANALEMIGTKRLSNGILARGFVARQWVSEDARDGGIPDAEWLYNLSVALQLPSAWAASFVVRGNNAWIAGCEPEEASCAGGTGISRGGSDAAFDLRLGRGIRVGTVTWDAAVDLLDLTGGAARITPGDATARSRAVRLAFRTAF